MEIQFAFQEYKSLILKEKKWPFGKREDRDLNINVVSSCHLEDKAKSSADQKKLKPSIFSYDSIEIIKKIST